VTLTRPLLVAPGACHVNRLQRLCDKRQESIATANVSSVTSSRGTHPVVPAQGTWHRGTSPPALPRGREALRSMSARHEPGAHRAGR
jgi:hypothetical protein